MEPYDGVPLCRPTVTFGPMDHNEALRKAIRQALKKKEWTHYRLAKETGMTVSTVDTAIDGGGELYYSTACKMLAALGLPNPVRAGA